MESFAGKLAVITGGGTGMGRELARQLTAEAAYTDEFSAEYREKADWHLG